jgi:elongator complex protein 3
MQIDKLYHPEDWQTDVLVMAFDELRVIQAEDKLLAWYRRQRRKDGSYFPKDELVAAYRYLSQEKKLFSFDQLILRKLQMKPTRTQSGVTPVTILTKPFPCPGKCIFCPNDIRMPKSYLSDEPGAQRAERNHFDPYLQTYNRLQALHNIGHSLDKVEIIILGGTWSYYPEPYQIWFIKEAFRALNDFGKRDGRDEVIKRYDDMMAIYKNKSFYAASNNPEENKQATSEHAITGRKKGKTYNQVVSNLYVAPERIAGFDKYQQATWEELQEQQKINETTECRNVGLVIETRPDNISEEEVIRIRKLGCTKTQIGFQSLQDHVLEVNHRGHDVQATRDAVRLLRLAGFKIHAHWMANLYGSNPELDKQDFRTMFSDPDFCPDELKLYPCSLIDSAELMQYYQDGRWKPYTHEELLDVVSESMIATPEYCRLTRVIRDIPSTDIVVGNTLTNFRQVAEKKADESHKKIKDIRAREVKRQIVDQDKKKIDVVEYQTSIGTEQFIQVVCDDEQKTLLAFVRLSLPTEQRFIEELNDAAVVRELHVYGPATAIGLDNKGSVQHGGLGTLLLEKAAEVAKEAGYKKLAVISAIGTREYYRKKGFKDGELYQHKEL